MADKMLCVLAGYDDQTSQRLEKFKECLKDFETLETRGLPHHITLCSVSTEREAEIKSAMIDAANDIKAFPITFNHIGIFGGAKVLFISPDVSVPLLKLKEQFGDSWNWTAHTTMLISEPDKIIQASSVLSKTFNAFAGEVDRLYLYEFFPARLICCIKLKKSDTAL